MLHRQSFIHKNNTYFFWTNNNRHQMPLVILPGFTGTHADLVGIAREFEDYFIIIPDFPGWGDSPKNGYDLTIYGYALFLHDLLESLSLTKKVMVVGHCMGSVVALEFAYLFSQNVKSLFLISVPYLQGSFSDAFFHTISHTASRAPKLLRPLFYFFRSRIFAIPLGFFVVQSKSLRKKLKIIFHNTIKQQFQDEDTVEKNWDSMSVYDYKKTAKISVPIHIFHGEKDILVPYLQAKKLAAMYKEATLDIIPHAGHMPPIETAVSLANALKKYL